MSPFWHIVAQVIVALGLAALILITSHLLGQRGRPGKIKDTPYECGIETKVEPVGPFSVKFYKVALLFILFDVELVFLLPWVLSFNSAAAAGTSLLIPGIVFVTTVALGLVYEIRKGGLNWEK